MEKYVRLQSLDHRFGNFCFDGAFPSKEIAELSYRFRTLGLGNANMGHAHDHGIPYDSERGRNIAAPSVPLWAERLQGIRLAGARTWGL